MKLPLTLRIGEYGMPTEQNLEYICYSLYLNVWAPANATMNSLLPVKVWIYGGGGTVERVGRGLRAHMGASDCR